MCVPARACARLLGAHEVVAQAARLLLRQHDDLDRLLREALFLFCGWMEREEKEGRAEGQRRKSTHGASAAQQ
jgi:hypothetical protein